MTEVGLPLGLWHQFWMAIPGAGLGRTLHRAWWVAKVFQSVGVTSGRSSLRGGSLFGLLYSKKTFAVLEQRNSNGSYTVLKKLEGKNHQTSLCNWIIVMFPDGLGNFAPVRSRKMRMN